ncbi:hypothetical protein AGMMS50239_09730 [Bacteroidia bacterium]|nr:hypothetical protein AGMMS50239_09730 [Bacteroidia bacterium]
MRNNCIYTVLFTVFTIFISCNKPINEERVYNGIDTQILNIVDSMDRCFNEIPFVTIWFSSCKDSSDNVIRFFNTILVPALNPLDYSSKSLISEGNGFSGYKKYHDIYLVFLNDNSNKLINKFVKKDSLNFDEVPFTHFNVYELNRKIGDCKTIEKKYFVNENDSLIFYEGKCLFDIE